MHAAICCHFHQFYYLFDYILPTYCKLQLMLQEPQETYSWRKVGVATRDRAGGGDKMVCCGGHLGSSERSGGGRK